MAKFTITGGKPLTGHHNTPGNKNAALPMLAACILTDQPVRLRNIPLIDDVHTMLNILENLGVDIRRTGRNLYLCAKGLRKRRLDDKLCREVRSSILFAGPMTARHGKAILAPPGGDVIGRRPLDTHFNALRQLGIKLKDTNPYVFERHNLRGANVLLDEASVTATENVVMAAVLAHGTTTIRNAACEPHVQDLCAMLNKMGALISGIGTNRLNIDGVDSLGGVSHQVTPDYIDAISFIAAAAITRGSIKIHNVCPEHLDIMERPFRKLGVAWTVDENSLFLPRRKALNVRNDFGSAIPRIEDGTWPGFPSDLMSVAIVLATQARGTMLFFEKMFESRMYFVDRLIAMGARIVQCDPHRVIVAGPSRLHGTHMSSPDIRAGMALLLAALCAEGTSTIDNAENIDRGYEKVECRLREVGASITRHK